MAIAQIYADFSGPQKIKALHDPHGWIVVVNMAFSRRFTAACLVPGSNLSRKKHDGTLLVGCLHGFFRGLNLRGVDDGTMAS